MYLQSKMLSSKNLFKPHKDADAIQMQIAQLYVQSIYCNVPKFSDRQIWANSVALDQTAQRAVWSVSTLFAIPSASFRCSAVLNGKSMLVKF